MATKTLPWKGIDKLDVDELGEEIYNRMTASGMKMKQAHNILEDVADWLDNTWGINTSNRQDLVYDYIDDWTDHFQDPSYTKRPSKWENYVQGELTEPEPEPEPEPDPYEERFKMIEGKLEAIYEYVKDTTPSPTRFAKFSKVFREAGTEAAEIAKAVSNLTEMANQLAPKPKRVVRKKR